jgi:hypothetical protein
MGLFKMLPVVLLLAVMALLGACGSEGASLDSQFAAWADSQTFNIDNAPSTNGLPDVPIDVGQAPRGVSTTPPDNVVKLGKDYLQMLNAEVDGDALVMQAPADGDPPVAYGLYKVEGLLDLRPTVMNVSCLPHYFDAPYFLGLADYTTGRWMWFGPIYSPEYELNLQQLNHRFITHLGNMYFLLVCPPGVGATHSQTTLFFGPSGDELPGCPTNLIASDGEFDTAVGLVWQQSAGAQYYEIYRHGGDPNGTTGEWALIGQSEGTEYLDETVTPGIVYGYKVRAKNEGGFSGYSNIDTGYAGTIQPPPDGFVIEGDIHFRGDDPAVPGDPVEGVTVQLLGLPDGAMQLTNADGHFRFGGLPAGNYIVVPGAPDKIFDPWYQVCEIGPNNPVGHANFLADAHELACWRTWGFVFTFETQPDGSLRFAPMQGVPLTVAAGEMTYTIETNADGYFVQMELPEGEYTVTPGLEGWGFDPASDGGVIDGVVVQPPLFFRGFHQNDPQPPNGSGVIEAHLFFSQEPADSGEPLANVPVMLLGKLLEPVWLNTDAEGNVRWGELPFGTYIVKPYSEHIWYAPIYARVELNADHPGVGVTFRGFEAPDAYDRLFGFCYGMQGEAPNHFQPLGGTHVTLQRYEEGVPVGEPVMVTANADGFYNAENIPVGNWGLTPAKEGWQFIPQMHDAHLTGTFFFEPLNFRGEQNVP